MPTPKKLATVEELADQLSRASMTIVADYRGLKVADLQGFRRTLRPFDAEFRIAKNTLTRIASEQVGIDGMTQTLEGPTGLVFVYGDIVGASKAVGDFARTSRILTVRGGILSNRYISASDVEAVATLPSMEELRGKFVGLLASPMTRTVGVLSGPGRSLAYLLQARADQLTDDAAA